MPGLELRIILGGLAAIDCRSPDILANDNPSREQQLFEHIVERELIGAMPD